MLRTVKSGDSYGLAPAVALVVTARDQVVILPECGEADRLAAVIEHTVWHPGIAVHLVGLVPSANQRLITMVESLIAASPPARPSGSSWSAWLARIRRRATAGTAVPKSAPGTGMRLDNRYADIRRAGVRPTNRPDKGLRAWRVRVRTRILGEWEGA